MIMLIITVTFFPMSIIHKYINVNVHLYMYISICILMDKMAVNWGQLNKILRNFQNLKINQVMELENVAFTLNRKLYCMHIINYTRTFVFNNAQKLYLLQLLNVVALGWLRHRYVCMYSIVYTYIHTYVCMDGCILVLVVVIQFGQIMKLVYLYILL